MFGRFYFYLFFRIAAFGLELLELQNWEQVQIRGELEVTTRSVCRLEFLFVVFFSFLLFGSCLLRGVGCCSKELVATARSDYTKCAPARWKSACIRADLVVVCPYGVILLYCCCTARAALLGTLLGTLLGMMGTQPGTRLGTQDFFRLLFDCFLFPCAS